MGFSFESSKLVEIVGEIEFKLAKPACRKETKLFAVSALPIELALTVPITDRLNLLN